MNTIQADFAVIRACAKEGKRGLGLLASHSPRYPYVYPRDSASAARFFRELSLDKDLGKEAFSLLEGITEFILSVQRGDGYWGQRHSLAGEDKSIYLQEDNIAHGLAILAHYLLAAWKLGAEPKVEDAKGAIEKGTRFAIENYFRKNVLLFYSTTSIFESRAERGYTLWVNLAYLRACELIEEVCWAYGWDESINHIKPFKQGFKATIFRQFIENGRYYKRILPNGILDPRPDITLMSPFYLGYANEKPEATKQTMRFIQERLGDPEFDDMIRCRLPIRDEIGWHYHAGSGPCMVSTAIMAQYHYSRGEVKEGNRLLKLIDRYRDEEGLLPEHLSTHERFREFMELEWQTGLDFKKEFDPEVLLPNLPFDLITEELLNMKRAYEEAERIGRNKGYIALGCGLMWAHVEYGRALLHKQR